MPEVTVFTATYNRAHTLARVYTSLAAQTMRDFEWLVVDDGSRDETPELLARWQAEADFPIRVLTQPNSGKHIAYNRAIAEAAGTYFASFDSDDACVPYALERFLEIWKSIPSDHWHEYMSVSARLIYVQYGAIGFHLPQDPLDSNPLDIRYRVGYIYDKWECYRTEVIRQYPYPITRRRSTHVPESLVWHRMARQYKTRYVNDVLLLQCSDLEADSLSGRGKLTQARIASMASGLALQHGVALNEEIDYFRYAPKTFLNKAANYTRFSLHDGVPIWEQPRELHNPLALSLWLVTMPAGIAVWAYDKTRPEK